MGVMRRERKDGSYCYVARCRIGGKIVYGISRETKNEAQSDSDELLRTGMILQKSIKKKSKAMINNKKEIITLERVRSFISAYTDLLEVEDSKEKIKDYCHQMIREINRELNNATALVIQEKDIV